MAHPHHEHKAHKVERERVHHITGTHHAKPKHYARGGHVHDDEAEDKAIIKKMVKKKALRADGGKVVARADKAPRRARGGHVKKGGKTNVNVIVAPGGHHPGMPGMNPGMAPPAPPPAAAAPPMPPRPPMAVPSQPPIPGLGGPGGMPMPRKRGGKVESDGIKNMGTNKLPGNKIKKGHLFGHSNMEKIRPNAKGHLYGHSEMKGYAKGGKVEGKKSSADHRGETGIGARTPIQHSGNKSDTQNIGRGPVITRKTGGPIYANGNTGKAMGPKIGAGNSGIGRLKKNHLARREHWEA